MVRGLLQSEVSNLSVTPAVQPLTFACAPLSNYSTVRIDLSLLNRKLFTATSVFSLSMYNASYVEYPDLAVYLAFLFEDVYATHFLNLFSVSSAICYLRRKRLQYVLRENKLSSRYGAKMVTFSLRKPSHCQRYLKSDDKKDTFNTDELENT